MPVPASGSDRSASPKNRYRLWVGVAVAAVVAGAAFISLSLTPALRSQPPSDAIGGPFTLTAGSGQMVADDDLRGKWLLIYFGYTHCPDICPTTLAEISETLKTLGPLAERVQPLFVTIDPERDTPEAVADFVNQFDDRITGLTGSPVQIAAVAKEYHVYYAKNPPLPAPGESYAMDHTAFVYVMGPDGKYVTLFSPLQGQTPDDMAAKLRGLIGVAQAQSR